MIQISPVDLSTMIVILIPRIGAHAAQTACRIPSQSRGSLIVPKLAAAKCVCVRVRACVWHHLDSTVRTLMAMFCLSAQRRKRARAEQRCPHVTARRWHVPAAQEMTGSHILRCAEDGDPFDAFWFAPSRPYVVVPRTW